MASVRSSSSSSRSSSPRLTAVDSSTALILVHDSDEHESNAPFDFSSDDDEEHYDPLYEVSRASIPPLSPSVVFLYLLSPYLKLGAMFLAQNSNVPLKYGIPALVGFALMSGFARQIWYMLARYLRHADMEDVILDAFARGRGKELRRGVIRGVIRSGTWGLRLLLDTIYFRESVNVLLPFLPDELAIPARVVVSTAASVLLIPLFTAKSVASKRIVYTTYLSVATYLVWLILVWYAHAHGVSTASAGTLRPGTLWQGITCTALAFTSSSTLPLYGSLKGTTQPISTAKVSKSRSFKTLSALSVSIAVLMILPLTFFYSYSNQPGTSSRLAPYIAFFYAMTLLLTIPYILVTTPSIPISSRIHRSTTFIISKLIMFVVLVFLSFVPVKVAGILYDIFLVTALSSTYTLPALLHVLTHFFKRPLAIIIPPSTPSQPSPAHNGSNTPNPIQDELLQRKERALQQRLFRKRIAWDVGVWVLLLPIGGGGLVWAAGRVAGRW